MERNHALAILILVIYLFFPQSSPPSATAALTAAIARHRHALGLLQNSTFAHPQRFPGLLPLTPPPPVREKWAALRGPRDERAAVYHNATGTVAGEWTRVELLPRLERTWANESFPGNYSLATQGTLSVTIEDAASAAGGEVRVAMRMKDAEGGEVNDVMLNGMHFADTGMLVAASTGDRLVL